jgi:hypothetical protein
LHSFWFFALVFLLWFLLWCSFGVALGFLWCCFGVALVLLWCCFGVPFWFPSLGWFPFPSLPFPWLGFAFGSLRLVGFLGFLGYLNISFITIVSFFITLRF